ncbi:MAG: hypothetical protein MK334_00005, partial [SAR202 cluster bacterium]|nr:hypothetical protein [SAR202 cluster bacterium]
FSAGAAALGAAAAAGAAGAAGADSSAPPQAIATTNVNDNAATKRYLALVNLNNMRNPPFH